MLTRSASATPLDATSTQIVWMAATRRTAVSASEMDVHDVYYGLGYRNQIAHPEPNN